MGAKKLYECARCVQYFKGKVAFDYHMNAHRRTDPKPERVIAPKGPRVYTGEVGENAPLT